MIWVNWLADERSTAPREGKHMMEALEPTRDPDWVLTHEGYSVLTENAVESRFALGNGFLGMRASRPVSRGPTWVSWQGFVRWASWPRCYVAGLFDRPNTVPPVPALVPVADWSRVRLVLDDNPQLMMDGEFLSSVRRLDMRRGTLLSDLSYRAHAGITISGGELRLVSLADRAVGLQLLRFSLDRDGIDVMLEANFAMAGMGMEPLQLDRDVSAWRTEGSHKAVAMAGSVTLRADGRPLVPERSFSLRWIWRWRSVAGQVLELDRLVTVARSDSLVDDPAPVAADALSRSRVLGWRGVLAAHETAWQQRWDVSDVIIEGDDDEIQEAVRFAVYHLTSAANPKDEHVSVGARGLTGDAYFGHVFWDTEIYLLPFYVTVWPQAARALLMYRYHTLPGARAKAVAVGYKGALYAWESADTGEETTPERVLGPGGETIDILTGRMEHHISADVAYAVWQYWRATGDDGFFIANDWGDPAQLCMTKGVRRYLRHAAAADLELDPNSAGGIRIAGLGGVWQAIVLGLAGVDLKSDTLGLDPKLPPQWRSLSFRVCWKGRSVAIRIDQVFGQGANNAVAPGIDLANLCSVLARRLQHGTGRGVYYRADAA
jgi:trehalose/maltose hydrolase-like predicted phosphorylase